MRDEYEVIIIGGSYAGLSAAMSLGRALRSTLIIDGGNPCNRQAPASHNFITQDGRAPAAIAADARTQVLAYDTVQFVSDEVTDLTGSDGQFRIRTASGGRYGAKKILFATGLHDELPAIPGLSACWGISAIHCPYCHGYEVRGQATGVLMNTDHSLQMVQLIRNWTDSLTLFTNGPSRCPPEAIAAAGARLIETPIRECRHEAGRLHSVVLEDGEVVDVAALYLHPHLSQKSALPARIGCAITENQTIRVDDFQMTTVTGVYAAGDCTTHMRSVAYATGGGNLAGAMINHALVMERFGAEHVGG